MSQISQIIQYFRHTLTHSCAIRPRTHWLSLALIGSIFCGCPWGVAYAIDASNRVTNRDQVVGKARELLETESISYVYGGSNLTSDAWCQKCNDCLNQKKSLPKRQLATCPVCQKCSLDCSHFIQLVFTRAGIHFPYLTTEMMQALPPRKLRTLYGFFDLGFNPQWAQAGDLLVYDGHVVLLEKSLGNGRGDIIHVTSGKDIKTPGQAIQRERNVDLVSFHGILRRTLRHIDLDRG